MKKKILTAIWITICLFGLVACSSGQKSDVQEPQKGGEEQTEQQEVIASYPENYVCRKEAGLFGNETYKRNDILTITIRDSLDGMADDAWDVSENKDGSVMAWVEDGTNFCIGEKGGVTARDCENLFSNFSNVTAINLNGCFYTNPAENFKDMFSGNWNLTELDLSSLNTSNAVTMEEMFEDCTRLLTLDISSFDTSKVENMASMFLFCQELKEIDVSSFDTGNVTNFTAMFKACYKLESLDLSGFDLSHSISCKEMFLCCELLSDVGCELSIPSGIDTTDMYDRSGME